MRSPDPLVARRCFAVRARRTAPRCQLAKCGSDASGQLQNLRALVVQAFLPVSNRVKTTQARIPVLLCLALISPAAFGQTLDAVRVVSRATDRTIVLPGEILPYLSVPIHAKVTGFVEKVEVDRGSRVQEGQLLATLVAPELNAQRAEAEAKVQAAEAQRVEAEARVVAAESTYARMKAAAETPGVIAGNELIQAEKQVDAERAKVRAAGSSVQAAQAAVKAIEEMQVEVRAYDQAHDGRWPPEDNEILSNYIRMYESLVRHAAGRGAAVIIASHERGAALACDRTLELKGGTLFEVADAHTPSD